MRASFDGYDGMSYAGALMGLDRRGAGIYRPQACLLMQEKVKICRLLVAR